MDTLLASTFAWDGIRQKSTETPVGRDTLDALGRGEKRKSSLQESFAQLLNNKKAEAYTRIKSGSDGKSIPIGAGSYTDSEWNRLLMKSVLDSCISLGGGIVVLLPQKAFGRIFWMEKLTRRVLFG